jgi:hypothetical protein
MPSELAYKAAAQPRICTQVRAIVGELLRRAQYVGYSDAEDSNARPGGRYDSRDEQGREQDDGGVEREE